MLLLVVGLAVFITTRDDSGEAQYKTLYDNAIGDNAKEIIIHAKGREDVVLRNKNDSWEVIKPSQFKADPSKVRHLFTLLSENAESNYPIAGKNLAEYGLDKDNLSVSFNGIKYIFGNLNAVAEQRLILKGETLYLIQETVSGLLLAGEESFKPDSKICQRQRCCLMRAKNNITAASSPPKKQ